MKSFDLRYLFVLIAAMPLTACETSGVGDPCIPEDEYRQDFSGYSVDEVNVESRSFQCETRVCLVANFQGRVTCPLGQTYDASLTPTQNRELNGGTQFCKIPGTDGSQDTDIVTSPVEPNRAGRRPDDAVYCSCRCADANGNTDDGVFCECPEGYSCVQLIEDLGLGNSQLAGGYCVEAEYNPAEAGSECRAGLENCPNCNPPGVARRDDPSEEECAEAGL